MSKEEIKEKIHKKFRDEWGKVKNFGYEEIEAFLNKENEILIDLTIEETAKAIFEEIERVSIRRNFLTDKFIFILDKIFIELKNKWLKRNQFVINPKLLDVQLGELD